MAKKSIETHDRRGPTKQNKILVTAFVKDLQELQLGSEEGWSPFVFPEMLATKAFYKADGVTSNRRLCSMRDNEDM